MLPSISYKKFPNKLAIAKTAANCFLEVPLHHPDFLEGGFVKWLPN